MHPWQELRTTTLQLQCHLWTVSLLMQDHLGWSHQAQQVANPRVVWINLLHLDTACKPPRTDSHGGTRILVCWQIPVCPASGMHLSACVSLRVISCLTSFSGEVQCEHTLPSPSNVCQVPPIFALRGIPSM